MKKIFSFAPKILSNGWKIISNVRKLDHYLTVAQIVSKHIKAMQDELQPVLDKIKEQNKNASKKVA